MVFDTNVISIHALREEGDLYTGMHLVVLFIFLSTPSARRATRYYKSKEYIKKAISIHALREEGDADTAAPPAA